MQWIPRVDDLANLFLSAGIGLGIQRAIDPSLPATPATGAIEQIVSVFAARGNTVR